MDFIIELLILCAIIGFIWGLVEAKVKGFLGEGKVSLILASLPQKEYRVLNNVMLPTEKGTTQIDHIVVSIYGIFVIETKNYKGWISGSEYSEQWTENFYGKKFKFFNPECQNYGHIKTLQNMLNLTEDEYISIIAFSPKATLKVKTKGNVVYFSKLKKTIRKYRIPVIELDQLDFLVSSISSANVDSKEKRKEHVQNIRQNVDKNKRAVMQGICPKCGGKLVYKKGKYGRFQGCSNYPNCRYTKNG